MLDIPEVGVPVPDIPLSETRAWVLTIRVADETFSCLATDVIEIVRPSALTRLPKAPACLLGLTSLHGAVLPVVSLARMLGRDDAPATALSRVVVVQLPEKLGVLVDEVCALDAAAVGRPLDIRALVGRHFAAAPPRAAIRHAAGHQTKPTTAPEETAELALIMFHVAGQDYALPLSLVAEVAVAPHDILAVPGSDGAMAGVTTLRGRLVPLVSMRALLGLPPGAAGKRARIVVTRVGGAQVGCFVDGIAALVRLKADAIDPVPPVLTRGRNEAQAEAIGRLDEGRRLVSILSPARLFDAATLARLSTEVGAEPEAAERPPEATQRFVVFRLGEEHFALPVACVREVLRRPDGLTCLPRGGAIVEGVMNLRGRTLPVINQARQFDVAGAADRRAGGLFMVVTANDREAIFVVDAVSDVLSVTASELQPAPTYGAMASDIVFDRVAMLRRDGGIVLVVDPGPLLALTESGMFTETIADP